MIHLYTTVTSEKEVKIEVKKSVFIANIKNVTSEIEAKAYISAISKKYNNARHNVPVYRVLSEDNRVIESYSDNGEPKGTAGMPILDILRGRNLLNVCLVVTRYFGGVLLGTGGLVRAYADVAKEAIVASEQVVRELHSGYTLTCDYNYFEKIKNKLSLNNINVENACYTDKISFDIYINKNQDIEGIYKLISDETNNNCMIELIYENIFR